MKFQKIYAEWEYVIYVHPTPFEFTARLARQVEFVYGPWVRWLTAFAPLARMGAVLFAIPLPINGTLRVY